MSKPKQAKAGEFVPVPKVYYGTFEEWWEEYRHYIDDSLLAESIARVAFEAGVASVQSQNIEGKNTGPQGGK